MPFPFQVAGFWTGAMRKYEGFGTAYAHKQTESGDPTDGGWVNLSEQRWLNSGERHRLSDQKYLSRAIDSRFGRLAIWRRYGWCPQCEV
jgi:hypothetical protein